jgi:hypothetical protein
LRFCGIVLLDPRPWAQFRHQPGLGFHRPPLDGGQRAGGAGELAHQHAWAQLRQPLAVAFDGGQQPGNLVAEGHGHRLLQVAAPDHRCVAMARGKLGQRCR